MIVLKLGGSVITDKDRPETLDAPALDRAADAVAGASDDLVVVHGGGSFGHHHAAAWGVSVDSGTDDVEGALAVHGAMTTLNRVVLARLHDRSERQVERMLAESFVPVLHGDVVATAGEGVTVVSGDELVARLARHLDADRVGLCSTVTGVYDDGGEVIPRITEFDAVADAVGGSESTDVTGGMAAKVRALLDLDAPAHVFGSESLSALLAGEPAGTVIEG